MHEAYTPAPMGIAAEPRDTLIGILDGKHEDLLKRFSNHRPVRGSSRHSTLVRGDPDLLETLYQELKARLEKFPRGMDIEESDWSSLCNDVQTLIDGYEGIFSEEMLGAVRIELHRVRVRIKSQFQYADPRIVAA